MSDKINSLKEHWKFNSIIGFIAVFVTDGIYLVAYFVIQSFFLMKGYNWDFIVISTERVQNTIMFLTPIVFIQVFILSWLGNFAERFEKEEPEDNELKSKMDEIDWDSI